MSYHCSCGHIFEMDTMYKGLHHCPKCDGLDYVEIPENFLEELLTISLGSLGASAMVCLLYSIINLTPVFLLGIIPLAILMIVLWLLKSLYFRCIYWIFKRKIAKKRNTSVSCAKESDSDSVKTTENTVENGTAEKELFFHRNVPRNKYTLWSLLKIYMLCFATIVVPFMLVIGKLIETSPTPISNPTGLFFACVFTFVLWLFSIGYWFKLHPLEISCNDKGIRYGKFIKSVLPWSSFNTIKYKQIPSYIWYKEISGTRTRVTPAYLKLRIRGTKMKKNLSLRFATDAEAEKCLNFLKEQASSRATFSMEPQT